MTSNGLTGEHSLSFSRRNALGLGTALTVGAVAIGAGIANTRGAFAAPAGVPAATPAVETSIGATIASIGRAALRDYNLKAVILRVLDHGQEVITTSFGESFFGQPATTDMHFRNGAVAISYVSTLLLTLVDDGLCQLDDPINKWAIDVDLPETDKVTLRMLLNMTSGYRDYVQSPELNAAIYADPFRHWTPKDLIGYSLAQPRVFAPGTNWEYSHTNYVILGLVIEAMTGTPVSELLQSRVLDPLGLSETADPGTPAIPEPVLHAYSSERRLPLKIASGTRFYEESTFWDPSWTITRGAIQYTTIHDMAATAIAIGEGTLLSPESHAAMLDPGLLGFGKVLDGCNTCHPLTEVYNYGLGIVLHDEWLVQNPLFAGFGSIMGYHPEKKLAVAVATTYAEAAFDDKGDAIHGNASQLVFESIAAALLA